VCGGRKYWEHPSTEVLCCCWHDTHDGSGGVWLPGEDWPHAGRTLAAHNASGFDRFAWESLGWGSGLAYVDTSELARTAGLPRGLDALGSMWCGLAKDKEASKFTKSLSSVRRPSKGDGAISAADWKLLSPEQKRERGALPAITAEALARVIPYCQSDVAIMAAGWPHLESWAALEPDVVQADRAINDRGVYLDTELCRALLECDQRNSDLVIAEIAAEIGETPARVREMANSTQQFTEATGATDAQKETVAEIVACKGSASWLTPLAYPLARARQAIASIVSGKLEAGLARVSADGYLRDSHRYYGGHTGRWSGQGMQLQNLSRPSSKFEDYFKEQNFTGEQIGDWIDRLAERVRSRKHHATPDEVVLLLRACICAAPGEVLIVRDFKGVEARALAWAAGDFDALDVFASGRDPYKVAAAKILGKRYEDVTGADRKIGKVAELACLAADTLVLTNEGPVPITGICDRHWLWDGLNWVQHRGVLNRGIRETVEYLGVTATPDHRVWCGSELWLPFEQLALDENTTCRALAIGSENLPSQGIYKPPVVASAECLCSAHAARQNTTCGLRICSKAGAQDATHALSESREAQRKCSGATQAYYRTRNTEGACSIGYPRSRADAKTQSTGNTKITGAAAYGCVVSGCGTEPRSCLMLSHLPGGTTQGWSSTAPTTIAGTNPGMCVLCRSQTTIKTNAKYGRCKRGSSNLRNVYDIAHAGPLNRFAVITSRGLLIVHNCGYQMGAAKLYARDGDKLDKAGVKAKDVVDGWRELHAPSVKLWYDCERAMKKACAGQASRVSCFHFVPSSNGRDVAVFLPSGRPIVYIECRVEDYVDAYGHQRSGVRYLTPKGRVSIYGGMIVENLIQALCRDPLARAMTRANLDGLDPRMSVHDELVCSVPRSMAKEGEAHLHYLMTDVPDYLPGFPLDADGFIGVRYRK